MNRNEIKEVLEREGRSLKWLLGKLDMPRSTYYYKCDTRFTESERKYINELLNSNFER